jgi:hypothetical protein
MLRFFLSHFKFNDSTEGLLVANEVSLEVSADKTKYLLGKGEQNASQKSQPEDSC